jgi:putative transcriptional regulator
VKQKAHTKLKSGTLLAASGNLLDPNFARSVVLVCTHGEEGTFGLTLNHPLDINLSDGIKDLDDWDAPLFRGGPVQENSLHVIHRLSDINVGSEEVVPGVFWGGDIDALLALLSKREELVSQCRFFVGYSGWGKNQLDTEIDQDSWYVCDASEDLIFLDDSANHWRRLFETMGPDYRVLANFPDDPSLN